MDNYVERYDKAEPRRLRSRQARKWIKRAEDCGGYEPAGLGPREHKACARWLSRQYRRHEHGKRTWWRWWRWTRRGMARWSRERQD